jgi:type I restriction enzyme S subunit
MLLSNLDLLATAPGGVARLRELILTLAVQGKLVAQDPNDEPASELLKKIRAEKDRLIAEGKIKRDKPLVVIAEDEKPFELPVGWEWVRLGTLTNISTGKLDANAAVVDGQYPFFTCSNTPLSIDRFSFDCSAILLAGNGDFNLKHYTGKFDAYQRTYVIEPILLDLRFLYFTLSKYIGELTKNQRGSAIPYLKLGDITNPAIPIPPTAEQSRIVTRVEELMRLCDALEAKGQLETTQHAQLVNTLLATLTESETPAQLADNWHRIATHFDLLLDRPAAIHALEQTILQLAVRGLLVPQDPQDEPASELLKKIRAEKDKLIAEGKIKRDKPLPPIAEDEQPFGLPPGWEWVPIETLADVGTGTTPSRDNIAFFSGGSIPWVTSGETGKPFIAETAQYVTELALSQTSLTVYPVGTLIVAMYGQGKTRGQVSELQIEATTNQACAAIVLVEPSSAHRSFVKLVFEKSYDEIRELSAGGAQPNLNVGKIKSTLIPLPPLAEQSRIVTRVAQLRRLCADLRQRLAASQSTQAHLAEALVDTVG